MSGGVSLAARLCTVRVWKRSLPFGAPRRILTQKKIYCTRIISRFGHGVKAGLYQSVTNAPRQTSQSQWPEGPPGGHLDPLNPLLRG